MSDEAGYPRIEDYAFLADCHSVALVSRRGSIDWCCMPRIDAPACFAAILDRERGGCFRIAPRRLDGTEVTRRYLGDSLLLETRFATADGEVRLVDGFTMRQGGRDDPHRQIVRVLEGVSGAVEIEIAIAPRFDYGRTRPWLRRHDERLYTAIGGDGGLCITSDLPLELAAHDRLTGTVRVAAGERHRLSLVFEPPHRLYPADPVALDGAETDRRLSRSLAWWDEWSGKVRESLPADVADPERLVRSAVVLKGLTHAPTGATAAAATTSLPESLGGERNWDYRYSWIRDASYAIRSLSHLGCIAEADGFRYFMERTTAGGANDIAIMYGVGGEHLYSEIELDWLDGYEGSRPVRLRNAAHGQLQLDVYGEVLELAWRAHQQGRGPDESYWRFLRTVVELARRKWRSPDSGIWEIRGEPRHFVHSKVMCWTALDRAVRLAEETGREAPLEEWRAERDEIRADIEENGVDPERGIFVQAYGGDALDAALLQLPRVDFVAPDDPRMLRTIAALREELDHGGLLRRYVSPDDFESAEGAFLACSFWLVKCLARAGRRDEAREVFDRAAATANDLGLFSEEYDPEAGRMLGNFPQALTHYAHVNAALALASE